MDPLSEFGECSSGISLDNASLEIGLQIIGKLDNSWIAIFWILLNCPLTDGTQLSWGLRCDQPHLFWHGSNRRHDTHDEWPSTITLRSLTCKQLIQHGPHGVDIREGPNFFAITSSLLWRHVLGRTKHRSVTGSKAA